MLVDAPNIDCAVVARRRQQSAVGTPRHRVDIAVVRLRLAAAQMQRGAIGIGGGKQIDSIVASGDSNATVGGRPTHSKKRALAHVFDSVEQRKCGGGLVVAPEAERAIVAARDESRAIAVESGTPNSTGVTDERGGAGPVVVVGAPDAHSVVVGGGDEQLVGGMPDNTLDILTVTVTNRQTFEFTRTLIHCERVERI